MAYRQRLWLPGSEWTPGWIVLLGPSEVLAKFCHGT